MNKKIIITILLTVALSITATAQLFHSLGLGFNGGERQGECSQPRMHIEGNKLFVCTNKGLYSKDLANNSAWQLYGFEGVPLQDYARRGSDILALRYNNGGGFLLLSHDDGKTYEDVTPDFLRGEKYEILLSLAQHPSDPSTLLVSSFYHGILRSTDFGQTWEQLTSFLYGNTAASFIGFHPTRPSIIYNSGEGEIMDGHINISYDGGQTWNDHGNSLGFDGDNCAHSLAFHPTNPDRWIAGGEGCVFLSDDNGQTWSFQDYSKDETRLAYWYISAFDNEHPETVYLAGGLPSSGKNNSSIKLMCSTNGGQSWYESQMMESQMDYDRVNDLQQSRDRLFIYTESDVYAVSKDDLVPQSTDEDQNVDQIIIKEIYCGGCTSDDGSKHFHMDKSIVLYNNCPERVVANNLCFGFATPYNAEANSNTSIYGNDGNLVYEEEGFIPAQNGIWYFPSTLVIEPFQQVVVNVHGAIDNTHTYSQSVNYAFKDYYCMYDPESGYNHTMYYPTPSDVIPTSHYLKTVKFGQGNSWPLSTTSPALFIFQPQDVSPVDFATNADNLWYVPGYSQTPVYACVKVPVEWIIDGVEVFNYASKDNCKKRLTADVDAGYVYLTNKLGHSLYRNVDQEMTEALAENEGKLVYDATQGADPSGIDAEESILKGAHIIYRDYNDSSNDFHERLRCSLRDYHPQGDEPVKGDVNGDGATDVADISAIISVMAGTEAYETADVNEDGTVDVADISSVISIMAGGEK